MRATRRAQALRRELGVTALMERSPTKVAIYVVHLFIYASILNYPWEVAQSTLFSGMGDIKTAWRHCIGSSLGDGLITLIVYAAVCLTFKNLSWSLHMKREKFAFVALLGLLVGASIEWIAVNVLNRWSYTPEMPLIPHINLGVFPVLQLAVLLPAIFFLASRHRI